MFYKKNITGGTQIRISWWYVLGLDAANLAFLEQNDLASAWDSISKLTAARIDIILDNSGFELYADLIFTLYLLTAGIADTVVLHPKSIPW